MKETFYSKIDKIIALILLVPILTIETLMVLMALDNALSLNEIIILESINVIYIIGLIIFLIPIRYVLNKDFLEIKCGLFIRYKIAYTDISSISQDKFSWTQKSHTILSRDVIRIELKNAKYQSTYAVVHADYGMKATNYIYISPKQKTKFLEALELKLS
ncbi:MAG: PH domain-containing protein [Opitutales bacterium]